MADWLQLHELSPDRVRAILARAHQIKPGGILNRRKARAALQPEPVPASGAWTASAVALARHCPPIAGAAETILTLANTNFAPDEIRFPRAFTLHDDGAGRPYVSCPYHGTVGDLMAVAHEFGHAVQVTASRGVQMPPALRETCAFISEFALLHALQKDDPSCFALALRVWQADTQKQLTSNLPALQTALLDETTPYAYQWNYPLARILAVEASRALKADEICLLFGGTLKTPELCHLLGI